MQVQEAQRVPNKMDARRPTPRHIIIKMPKARQKEKLKSIKRKEISYQLVVRWEGGCGRMDEEVRGLSTKRLTWLVWHSGLSARLQTTGLLVRFPDRTHA